MSNKTDIEEDIKILEKLKSNIKEASECSLASGNERKDWQREVQAIENILADREKYKQLYERALSDLVKAENKANKYDSLIEKINNRLEYAENLLRETGKGNLQKYTPSELIIMIDIYVELLDTEK